MTLPCKLPLNLMLGAEGIAVGLSARILPHNFPELLEAQIAILKKQPFKCLPDFMTGGLMDARYYLLANRPSGTSPDAKAWQARTDSLNDLWHERIPTNVALMCDYFGKNYAQALVTVSQQSNVLEGSVSGNFAQAAENARHDIFLLELNLAEELRRGDIFDRDLPLGDCKTLA